MEARHNFSKCATYDLEDMKLSLNMIGGTLTSWFGDFKCLRTLNIYGNAIEGPIPVSIGSLSYLENLDLFSNNLTGTLRDWLGDMRKLRVLRAYRNRIFGEIPTLIGSLSYLEEFDLSDNNLTGTLPDSLDEMIKLGVFRVSGNSINGTIPECLGQCKPLVEMDLSSNNLQGVVSESLFANLSSLNYLELSSNSLEVNLHSNWTPPFQLFQLSLKSCKLQTQIPQCVGPLR
ncbi:hypothetical protein RND81_12G142700 [Saponaria officinalis]|uniref:Disease resistance R13L4/SHOC-2-like LRR domain-containing protein n=1 Tax=Saponaria officinalis TaxID=3572 RepID=A0AAW1HAH4_SAPOF